MRDIYINSRLDSLSVAARRRPRNRIFSLGNPWFLLTPRRLARLAFMFGLDDRRIERIITDVRRHSGNPRAYCLPLGMETEPYYDPEDYPPALCPVCDGVHQPHPLDVYQPCSECLEKKRIIERNSPGPLVKRDLELDEIARIFIREREPSMLCDGELSPNWRYNYPRRLVRDWDAAVNRILTGGTYRQVAREFDCSVGLLHRKVKERNFWEDN